MQFCRRKYYTFPVGLDYLTGGGNSLMLWTE
jgi:hypothetical protein